MKKQIAISLPLIFAAFVAYAASGDTGTPLTDAVEGAEKEPVEMCMLNGELVPEIEDDHAEDGKDSDDDANEAEDGDTMMKMAKMTTIRTLKTKSSHVTK